MDDANYMVKVGTENWESRDAAFVCDMEGISQGSAICHGYDVGPRCHDLTYHPITERNNISNHLDVLFVDCSVSCTFFHCLDNCFILWVWSPPSFFLSRRQHAFQ
jgi:hypothetical protein